MLMVIIMIVVVNMNDDGEREMNHGNEHEG